MQNNEQQMERVPADPKIELSTSGIKKMVFDVKNQKQIIDNLNVQISQYQRQIQDLENMLKQKFVDENNNTIAEEIEEIDNIAVSIKSIKNLQEINDLKKIIDKLRQKDVQCSLIYRASSQLFKY